MYIADFYCHKAESIIKVERGLHKPEEVKNNDGEKNFFANKSFRLLRFSNEEGSNSLEAVLQKIITVVNIDIRKHAPLVGG